MAMPNPNHDNGGAELYFRECIDELEELPEYITELDELIHVNQRRIDKLVDRYGDVPDLLFDKLCRLAMRSHMNELVWQPQGPSTLEPITPEKSRNVEDLLEEASIKMVFTVEAAVLAVKKWYLKRFEKPDTQPPDHKQYRSGSW